MANIKITDLDAYTNPDSTDVLPIVDVGADETKKVSIADLMENAGGGTEGLPGIAFGSDPDTGIYRPDDDQLAISTGGTQRILIDNSGVVTVAGDLTVNGTTTTVNSTTLTVDDKNIELGSVASPTDTTADGGGITLKGATDKTLNWVNSSDSWTSSENVDLASGKTYKINGTDVLSGSTLGSGVTGSSLTSVGTITTGVWNGTALTADAIGADAINGSKIADDSIDSEHYVDGSIDNVHVSASAAIAGTKIDPDFGSQTVETTGVFSAAGGAQGTPSITFTGDLNTGFYSPGADQVAISTGGTQRINVEADGDINIDSGGVFYDATNNRLGVGTTSPNQALEVVGSQWLRGAYTDSTALGWVGNSGTGRDFVIKRSAAATMSIEMSGRNAFNIIGNTGDTNCNITFSTTGSSEAVRIDSSGRVGIGSSTPGQLLHLRNGSNPAIQIDDTTNSQFIVSITSADAFGNGSTVGQLYLRGASGIGFTGNGGASTGMVLDSSNRLGIGTTSPSQLLDLKGSSASLALTSAGASDTSQIYWLDSADAIQGYLRYDHSGESLAFAVNGASEKMRIDSNGNIGIGPESLDSLSARTSLGYRSLRVQNANITAAGGSYAMFGVNYYQHTDGVVKYIDAGYSGRIEMWGDYMSFNLSTGAAADDNISGSERMRIDSSGRLLVGTTSARTINGYDVWQGLQLAGATGNEAIVHERYSNDGGGAHLFFGKSRGSSVGSYTSVQSGDALGQIVWCGADGTDMGSSAASIRAVVDGTPGSNDMPGRLVFSTTADGASSPTERMRISSGGMISQYSDTGWENIRVGSASAAGTTRTFYTGYYSATAVNTGTLSYRVYTNGNVQNTNNSYGAISDIKLKENIVDASSQWDDLKAIQVRNYNFKEGQTHTQIGVVAQEVELVSPGLVTESPDTDAEGNDLGTTTKSVNYSVLYMKAVKALQEAMERIETLEAKVAALEAN